VTRPRIERNSRRRRRVVGGETPCATLPVGVRKVRAARGTRGSLNGHTSRRKVVGGLGDVFRLDISLGALSEAEAIVSAAVAPAVEEARVHALAEHVKHVDVFKGRVSHCFHRTARGLLAVGPVGRQGWP